MNVDETVEAASSDFFWVPDDVHVVERDEITYTHSDRPAALFNAVTRVRPGEASPDDLVREVVERHRGSKSRWNVTAMADDRVLLEALREAGYRPGYEHRAYAIDVDDYDRDVPGDVEVRDVANTDELRDLYRVASDVSGEARSRSDEELAHEVDICTGPERRVARFLAVRGGEPAGSGGLTFFDGLSFGLLWGGGVRESHRGHGVYTSLLQARADAAEDRGIERVGLYGRQGTSGPIVEAHGFERHGPMVYWVRDMRD